MAWAKLTTKTLTGTTNTVTTDTFVSTKFNVILFHKLPSGNADGDFRFGNTTIDSGSNYAWRNSQNGGADSTATSSSYISDSTLTSDADTLFSITYLVNISAEEKLAISFSNGANGSVASVAPERTETVGKWSNTSSQINIIQIFENGAGGNFDTDSNLSAIGTD